MLVDGLQIPKPYRDKFLLQCLAGGIVTRFCQKLFSLLTRHLKCHLIWILYLFIEIEGPTNSFYMLFEDII
jgi:hypothetical protein